MCYNVKIVILLFSEKEDDVFKNKHESNAACVMFGSYIHIGFVESMRTFDEEHAKTW